MHITYLKIENFRGIKSLEINPQKQVILLYGPNGAGKTTALDAIRFALTGVVRDQTGSTLKLDRLGKARVELWLSQDDKTLKITAKISGNRSTLDTDPVLPGNINEVRAGIWTHFGLDSARERLALDPLALLLGKDLLAALTAHAEISPEQLRTLFGDCYDDAIKLVAIKTTADITSAADKVYDRRTDVNREIKSLEVALKRTETPCPTSKQGRNLAEADIPKIEESLRLLLNKRHEIDRQIDRCDTGRTQEQIDQEEATVRDALASLKVKEIPTPSLPEKPKAAVDSETLERLRSEWKNADHLLLEAVQEQCSLSEIDTSTACPTCKRVYTPECLDQIASRIAELADEIEQRQAALDKARKAFDKWASLWKKDATLLASWEQECARLNHEYETARKYAERDYAHEKLRLEKELARLEKEQPAGDKAALQAERDQVQAKLEAGQDQIDKFRAWQEQQSMVAELAEKRQTTELLTWLIDLLRDPNTLKALGNDGSTFFEADVNDIMAIFGYKMRVNWESLCIEITKDTTDDWRPLAEASAGELTLAQIAVADVYGGSGLALIDRFEGVDSEHAPRVWDLLRVPVGGRVIAQTTLEADVPGVTCVGMWGFCHE